MWQMSTTQLQSFFETPRFAVFGTNRSNGFPHLSTVWFLYQKSFIYVVIEKGSVKYRNIKQDPRVTICINGEHPNGQTVVVYGKVEIMDTEQEETNRISWDLTRRYHDSNKAARCYQESVKNIDSVILKLTPYKIIARDFSGYVIS